VTDKEAMKLALEALENSVDLVSNEAREAEKMYANVPTRLARVQGLVALEVAHEKAIAALKERLAQPHETTLKEFNQLIYDDPKYHIWAKEKEALAEKSMREVQRLGQEIEQEPVAYLVLFEGAGKLLEFTKGNYLHGAKVEHIPLYTHPPQRTWVGLTDEEIAEGIKQSWVTEQAFQSAAWWAEAKLKEKNT